MLVLHVVEQAGIHQPKVGHMRLGKGPVTRFLIHFLADQRDAKVPDLFGATDRFGDQAKRPAVLARIVVGVPGKEHAMHSPSSPVKLVTDSKPASQRESGHGQGPFHEQQGQRTRHRRQVLGHPLITDPDGAVPGGVPLNVQVRKIVGAVGQVQLQLVAYPVGKSGETGYTDPEAAQFRAVFTGRNIAGIGCILEPHAAKEDVIPAQQQGSQGVGALGILGNPGGNFLPCFLDRFRRRLLAGITRFIDSPLL